MANSHQNSDQLHRQIKALKDQVGRYRHIIETLEDGYFECDLQGNILFFNPAVSKFFRYPAHELRGINYRDIVGEENAEKVFTLFNRVFTSGRPSRFDFQVIRKDGIRRVIEASVSLNKDDGGEKTGFRALVYDITERKQAEGKLKENEEMFRTVLETIGEGITFSDEKGHFEVYNRAMERITGYSQTEANDCPDFNRLIYPDPRDQEQAMKRVSELLRTRKGHEVEVVIRSKAGGLKSILVTSSLVVYKGRNMFLSAYRDITERKQAEEEIKQSVLKLRQAMGGTIQAISAMVETRDPYTSGHQQRVANLGRAIARELNLSEEQIDGLRMAGAIHDLGKIYVPGEILSKPGRLMEMEISLIRIHPQVGYDILKDIEFPWPIAEIVRQHHERLDGSGYPQGLKGDEILMEARILAVADVVEAMASHRPYRPALGIEAALGEIEKNKGILYDPEVVEVCLRLFNEKEFRWE